MEKAGKGKSWKKEKAGKGRKWKRKKMENKKVLTTCRKSAIILTTGKTVPAMSAGKKNGGRNHGNYENLH